MGIIYSLISIFVGGAGSVQSLVNGQLKIQSGNSIFSAFASFVGGVITLGVLLMVSVATNTTTLPSLEMLYNTKWWMWIGGILGVMAVIASIVMPPRIGFTAFFGAYIAGQLIVAVIIDHFGILGNPVQSINVPRLIGVLCLFIGVALVQKY